MSVPSSLRKSIEAIWSPSILKRISVPDSNVAFSSSATGIVVSNVGATPPEPPPHAANANTDVKKVIFSYIAPIYKNFMLQDFEFQELFVFGINSYYILVAILRQGI